MSFILFAAAVRGLRGVSENANNKAQTRDATQPPRERFYNPTLGGQQRPTKPMKDFTVRNQQHRCEGSRTHLDLSINKLVRAILAALPQFGPKKLLDFIPHACKKACIWSHITEV